MRISWLTLLCLCACSDYEIQTTPGQADPLPGGEIAVSPDAVSLWHCADAGEVVATVQNLGPGPLQIEALETTGDWQVQSPPQLPHRLEADASLDLGLQGTGVGSLEIHSDDPLIPVWTVPLASTLDQAPVLDITSPTVDEVLSGSGDLVLSATLHDVHDDPASLVIHWSSDLDGDLGTSTVDASGVSSLTWPGPRTAGTHQVTASTEDACALPAADTVDTCMQASFTEDEVDIASWNFEGSALWDGTNSWLELTSETPWLVGTAFETSNLVPADDVEIRFSFYIGDGTGADGISLTALDTARMTTFLGGSGCGLGYGGGDGCTAGPALPGWTIEVDTFYNPEVDPTAADHLQFTFDGDLVSTQTWVALPEMEDTGWHEMVVQIIAPWVHVEIDGITYLDEQIHGHYAFDSYVGFTAGTGGDTNSHLIDSLVVTEMSCPE